MPDPRDSIAQTIMQMQQMNGPGYTPQSGTATGTPMDAILSGMGGGGGGGSMGGSPATPFNGPPPSGPMLGGGGQAFNFGPFQAQNAPPPGFNSGAGALPQANMGAPGTGVFGMRPPNPNNPMVTPLSNDDPYLKRLFSSGILKGQL